MKRQDFHAFLKRYYPVMLFFILFVFIFWKIFLKGLVPVPGDLLVSFFFPYTSGGWEGFTEFVAHKEFISADVIRQIYPWRIFSVDLFKQGILPLWNPYAFSGTPLLANIQSAVFYPINILFLFFEPRTAWVVYILLQPILGACFMYLFLRSLRLPPLAGIFCGLAFGFIGYNIVWYELGVVGHTALWLPLCLWGITSFGEKKRTVYLIVTTLALSMTLFAGHVQTAMYVYLVSFAYYVFYFRTKGFRFMDGVKHSWVFLLSGGIAAVQILPSLELLLHSARDAGTSSEVFYTFQVPLSHLVMLLAPDYFGNPGGGNFWGIEYDEFLSSVGVIALVFATLALFQKWKDKTIRFFFLTGIIALLFALPTVFSNLLQQLNVPILGTGLPSRSLFVLEFVLVVLSGFGVQQVLDKKISIQPFVFLGVFYALLWFTVLSGVNLLMVQGFSDHIAIAKRNLILPTALFALGSVSIFLSLKRPQLRFFVVLFCLFLAAFEYQYQTYKYQPFAPTSFIFPSHPLITYLQKETPPYRVYGYDTARIETNFPTQFRIQSPEGYDPLYIRQYGELVYGVEKGRYERLIPRSDAVFPSSLASTDSPRKQRVMNILGVKYAVDKNDAATGGWQPERDKFPESRYNLHWQQGKYKVYENLKSFPRAAVFYQWQTIPDDSTALNTLLADKFPYESTLILSDEVPYVSSSSGAFSPASILSYTPNEVIIKAEASTSGMLFLSDAYYPGWQAYIDGVKTDVYRADYALRAVPITNGTHTVIFRYEPLSFVVGLVITVASGVFLAALYFISRKQHKQHYEKKVARK